MITRLLTLFEIVAVLAWGAAAASAQDGHVRSQTIALEKGWNAVFLEVDPLDSDLSKIFSGKPVDIVAAHQTRKAQAGEFTVDPTVDLFAKAGWGVWYADHRPDAFLTTLYAMFGGEAYLIHASKAFTWNVQGQTVTGKRDWKPGAYNLVGFEVSGLSAPTFSQFFGASEAHQPLRVYRLRNNAWRLVTQPASENLKASESFWVFSKSSSIYEGPLSVSTEFADGLFLGGTTDRLVLENKTDHPLGVTLEHVTNGATPVPLSLLVTAIGRDTLKNVSVKMPVGKWTQELAPLEAGQSISIAFEARVEAMTAPVHTSLLKISTDMGTEKWVPVHANRPDLRD